MIYSGTGEDKRKVVPATVTINLGVESFSKTVANLEPTVHCCKKNLIQKETERGSGKVMVRILQHSFLLG